jgi:hypothetical protein
MGKLEKMEDGKMGFAKKAQKQRPLTHLLSDMMNSSKLEDGERERYMRKKKWRIL